MLTPYLLVPLLVIFIGLVSGYAAAVTPSM